MATALKRQAKSSSTRPNFTRKAKNPPNESQAARLRARMEQINRELDENVVFKEDKIRHLENEIIVLTRECDKDSIKKKYKEIESLQEEIDSYNRALGHKIRQEWQEHKRKLEELESNEAA